MTKLININSDRWFSGAFLAAAAVAALQVGTGGLPTENYYKARGKKGYAFASYDVRFADEVPSSERGPSENTRRIREVFKFTVTEMATLFGVSRQAIYDWQSGKPVAVENVNKLRELANAADRFASANVQNMGYVLRRKLH